MKSSKVYRGEVYLCDLGENKGSVQKGIRPVVVVQNNFGNMYSSTIIVAPVTSKKKKNILAHVDIKLQEESVILCEQLTTVEKTQLGERVGYLSGEDLIALDHALHTSLGL